MINSTKKQKNYLNYLFLKKFKLMDVFDEMSKTILDGDEKCAFIKFEHEKKHAQQRINDVDNMIDKYLEIYNAG